MRIVLACTLLTLSACRVSIDSFCDEEARAGCETGQRCGTVSRKVDCSKQRSRGDCLGWYRTGLGVNVLTYDAEQAHRCIEARRGRSCGDVWPQEACSKVVTGEATEGEQCGGCAAGLTCRREGERCGVCRPVVKPEPRVVPLGQACVPIGVGANCADGLACVGEVCVALLQQGAQCGRGAPCGLGLQCSVSEQKCVPVPDLGDACSRETGCLGYLRCVDGHCALMVENGGGCLVGEACRSDFCVDGTCQPQRSRDEACDEPQGLFCAEQLDCVSGVCTPRPTGGEPCPRYTCASPAECVAGMCHDPFLQCR